MSTARRRVLGLMLGAAALAAILLLLWPRPPVRPLPDGGDGPPPGSAPPSSPGAAAAGLSAAEARRDALGRPIPVPERFPALRTTHPVAEESWRLNRPETAPAEDLQILGAILEACGRALGSHPSGENAEFVASLTGRNPRGLVFIPTNHPALRADGQLVDRWGTPFHFHPVTRKDTQIVSAGPDRVLWTADDLVLP